VKPKPGTRYKSQVGDTEIVVVRAPATDIELNCGGQPVIGLDKVRADGAAPAPGLDDAIPVGKRYVDEAGTIEVLVTKAGTGTLAIGDAPLVLKTAKPLPSSD
jgi:hypothetical protein